MLVNAFHLLTVLQRGALETLLLSRECLDIDLSSANWIGKKRERDVNDLSRKSYEPARVQPGAADRLLRLPYGIRGPDCESELFLRASMQILREDR